MSESEIIRLQYEAIKKFCQGDKKLALRITSELGATLRGHFNARHPDPVTVEELCTVLERETCAWREEAVRSAR